MESQQHLQGDFGGQEDDIVDAEIIEEAPASASDPQEDKPREKPRQKEKINHLIREKYRALGEANEYRQRMQELAMENARLQEQAQASVQHSMMQFDANTKTTLELARKNLKEAEESGDIESKLRAQEELMLAITMHERSNQWKVDDQIKMQREQEERQAQQYYQPEPLETRAQPYLQEFYADNSDWLEPSSPHFNQALFNEVTNYTARENQRLINLGMEHLLYTPEYFQALQSRLPAMQAAINRRGGGRVAPPRQAHPQVASARGSVRRDGRRSSLPPLNKDQHDLIRSMGITEEAYRAAQKEVAAEGGFETQRIKHQYKRGFM
jgi:hypothetical protein